MGKFLVCEQENCVVCCWRRRSTRSEALLQARGAGFFSGSSVNGDDDGVQTGATAVV